MGDKSAKAFTSNLQVHFKNTRETAHAIKGKHLAEAKNYLLDVVAHKRCVPFRRYNGNIGRTSQAKSEGGRNGQGVWPEKSCKLILNLLKNAESNAKFRGLDIQTMYVRHIQVNRAMPRS